MPAAKKTNSRLASEANDLKNLKDTKPVQQLHFAFDSDEFSDSSTDDAESEVDSESDAQSESGVESDDPELATLIRQPPPPPPLHNVKKRSLPNSSSGQLTLVKKPRPSAAPAQIQAEASTSTSTAVQPPAPKRARVRSTPDRLLRGDVKEVPKHLNDVLLGMFHAVNVCRERPDASFQDVAQQLGFHLDNQKLTTGIQTLLYGASDGKAEMAEFRKQAQLAFNAAVAPFAPHRRPKVDADEDPELLLESLVKQGFVTLREQSVLLKLKDLK